MSEKNIKDFIEFLKTRLLSELPGIESHKKMAPRLNQDFFRTFKPTSSAKESAVLVPLFFNNGTLEILFTLRSENISHSGQISFPGGRCEVGESHELTALRETHEETGIGSQHIQIIGKMSQLYVPPSKNIITPIVGLIDSDITTIANIDEVQEIFYIPFEHFTSGEYFRTEEWDFSGTNVDVPFWDVHHSTPLWGATAMMLHELIDLWEEFRNN